MGLIHSERFQALRRRLMGSRFVRDAFALQVGKLVATGMAALSYIITLRLLGPSEYGVYGLANGFLMLLYTVDFTGMGSTISTLLGIAIGKRDVPAVLDTMAAFMRISWMVHGIILLFLWLLGGAVAGALYPSGARVGLLAAVLALALPVDSLYVLITTALLARRQMRAFATLQILNQLTLTVCVITALLIHPFAESMIAARLVFSVITMLMAWSIYARRRLDTDLEFPPLMRVFGAMRRVRLRPYLGVGFANAVDKSLGNLMLYLPQQLVGVLAGERAAGYLISATNGVNNLSLLTGALFDTMRAVVPQRVGARDYQGLWRVMGRVLVALAIGSAGVYGGLALFAPLFVPPLLGETWRNIIPVLSVAAIFGAISTVGGVFGPLYRALNRIWGAVVNKLIAFSIVLPVGFVVLGRISDSVSASDTADMMRSAALTGAWMIVVVYGVSVGLTAWMSLRALYQARSDV